MIKNEYARALFELCLEQGTLDKAKRESGLISEILERHPLYIRILESPVLSADDKRGLIKKAFGKTETELIKNMAELLCMKGKIRELEGILKEFIKLCKARERELEVVITSVQNLDEAEKNKLIQILGNEIGARIIPKFRTDETLIGGFTVSAEGIFYDASLKSRLKKLKEVIAK